MTTTRQPFAGLALLLALLLLASSGPVAARPSPSFFDGFPVLSQMKSLVQVIAGDAEGARKTQENFVNQVAIVSQVKSLVQVASGDAEGARQTQLHFVRNLESVVDGTPVVGHVKGVIHMAAGDEERGVDIIKGSTSSAGALLGALVGGPAGAVAGGAIVDGVISAVDEKPFGIVDYVANIDEKTPGEHFDQIAGLGLDLAGGKAAKKVSSAVGKPPARAGFAAAAKQTVAVVVAEVADAVPPPPRSSLPRTRPLSSSKLGASDAGGNGGSARSPSSSSSSSSSANADRGGGGRSGLFGMDVGDAYRPRSPAVVPDAAEVRGGGGHLGPQSSPAGGPASPRKTSSAGSPIDVDSPRASGGGSSPIDVDSPRASGGGGSLIDVDSPRASGGGSSPMEVDSPRASGGGGSPMDVDSPRASQGSGHVDASPDGAVNTRRRVSVAEGDLDVPDGKRLAPDMHRESFLSRDPAMLARIDDWRQYTDEARARVSDARKKLGQEAFDRTLQRARLDTGLPAEHSRMLQPVDFLDVNLPAVPGNCYFCASSAHLGLTNAELSARTGQAVRSGGTLRDLRTLLERGGAEGVRMLKEGTAGEVRSFLQDRVKTVPYNSFVLAYDRPQGIGHMVNGRTWLDPATGNAKMVLTDFQRPLGDAGRFLTDLPADGSKFYVVSTDMRPMPQDVVHRRPGSK